ADSANPGLVGCSQRHRPGVVPQGEGTGHLAGLSRQRRSRGLAGMDSYGSTHGGSSLDLNGQSNRNQAVWHPQCHAFPGFQWSSGGNQRTGSSFKGPVPGIPEQGEIQTGNLVPLWRAAYGTQPTRISEEPHIHRVYFVTYLATQTASLQPHGTSPSVHLTLSAGARRQERPLPAIVKDQLTGKSSRTPKFPWSLFDFFQPPTITALQKNMGS